MTIRFGNCELDADAWQLRRGGEIIPLRPKAFALLSHLIAHRSRVVSKKELLEQLWPNQAVTDAVLTTCVRQVRAALGDDGHGQRTLQTVHGRGYRFVGEIIESSLIGGTLESERTPENCSTPGEEASFASAESASKTDGERALPDASTHLIASTPCEGLAEYKTVSVLACRFAPIGLNNGHHSPEQAHAWRRSLQGVTNAVIEELDGKLFRVFDDGLMVIFGLPQAQEDHAVRALQAALTLRERFSPCGDAPAAACELTGKIVLSSGVHTGVVMVSPAQGGDEGTVTSVGDTFNFADLMRGVAGPGDILLSPDLVGALGNHVRLETKPVVINADQHALRLLDLATAVTRRFAAVMETAQGLTPFVGRKAELGLLESLLDQSTCGRGQVVGLVGEAGVGKSRVLAELCARHRGAGGIVMMGQCMPHARTTPFFPLAHLMLSLCGIHVQEGTEAADQKLTVLLQELGVEWSQETKLLLLDVLRFPIPSMGQLQRAARDPRGVRDQAFVSLRCLVSAVARRHPSILAIEDVHWIDSTSEEWLETLIREIAGTRLLVIMTYRPGYRPTWLDRSYATQQAVQPLTMAESAELVRNIAGSVVLSTKFVERVLRLAEGNPLFLEELTHAVRTRESAVDDEDNGLPQSLQAMLSARLDSVPPAAKLLLQTASVVGREVPQLVLEEVLGEQVHGVSRLLDWLQAEEFVVKSGDDTGNTYTFKHALIQDAVYGSLLSWERKRIHQRVAECLAASFPEIARRQPELLAQHFEAAGETEHAIQQWYRAAQLAIERCANVEAIAQIERGLALVRELPPSPERDSLELQLETQAAGPRVMLYGHASAETTATLKRILELGKHERRATDGFLEFAVSMVSGRLEQAHGIAQQLVALGGRGDESAVLVQGHNCMAFVLFHLGRIREALEHSEACLTRYDPRRHAYIAFLEHIGHNPAASAGIYGAHSEWLLGRADTASQRATQTVESARQMNHEYSLAMVLYMDAWHATFHHLVARVEARAEEALAICSGQRFPYWLAGATVTRGWALAKRGHIDSGIARMKEGIQAWQRLGTKVGIPYCWALYADICVGCGRVTEGNLAIQKGFCIAEETGEQFYLSELHRLQGELALLEARPQVAQAAEAFCRARDLACSQGALALQLRSATSMARLLRTQGEGSSARSQLLAVYERFEEGHTTHDLAVARAELELMA